MPPSRSKKMGCAYDPVPQQKPRKVLTPEEKEAKKDEALIRKAEREVEKTWEVTLKPTARTISMPVGTLAIYKSDAKSAYGLTELEMSTIPHEAIPCSSKTFYPHSQVVALAERKFDAGATKAGFLRGELHSDLRLFKKTDDDKRKRRGNFTEIHGGYMNPISVKALQSIGLLK